ncbi:CBS domain-containing protein [Radiobacillus sp. PE A8.2]|uniref:CBS domain-containing protein n=1 Tax=Radiobacillus sp. PE A8.2 TaxID=3380349 RepID=UPI0038907C6C
MFVKSTMMPHYQCKTAAPNESLEIALAKLEEHDFQAMPVVEGELFRGMISKQIIYRSFYYSNMNKDEFLSSNTVSDVMTNDELYIGQDDVFEKTFTSFKDFPIVAVVGENRKFIGIVTRYDVLEQFESAFGTRKKGVRIAFTSIESTGRFARLADIIKQIQGNIISITTFDETDNLTRRIVLKIDHVDNKEKLANKLEKSGFRVLDITEM